MGMHLVSYSFLQAVLAGVFGGWLVAQMSWLVESSKSPFTSVNRSISLGHPPAAGVPER